MGIMNSMLIILMLFSLAVMGIGGIIFTAAAFRQNLLWGMACLIVPFASLVFVVRHWYEAKSGFLTSVAGAALFAGVMMSTPATRNALATSVHLPWLAVPPHESKAQALDKVLKKKRGDLFNLQDQLPKATEKAGQEYTALAGRRQALNAADKESVRQFNLDAAAYQQHVLHLKELTQGVDAATKELGDLTSQRAAMKEVVIYSTSWCPACKMAKNYMDGKGISYRDVDVEKSPEGAAEYRRLGGSGAVPFIVVGDKTMTGFSAQQLEAML
jgi:glutaredoxin